MERRTDARNRRAQFALDFMVSYGMVILAIAIALFIIYELGAFNPQLSPGYCNAAPSFSCGGLALSTNGVFTVLISQSLGGAITITGAACSTEVNGTGTGPKYGNVDIIGANAYYPSGGFTPKTVLTSTTSKKISLYCYSSSSNLPAKGSLGSTFVGYLWLNYTYTGLPSNYPIMQQVITFSTDYAAQGPSVTTSTSVSTTSLSSTSTSTTSTSSSTTTSSSSTSTTLPYAPPVLTLNPNSISQGGTSVVTAICASGDTCHAEAPLGTLVCSGTTTCTADVSPSSSTVYYANDLTIGVNSIGNTLTVTTAAPPVLTITPSVITTAQSATINAICTPSTDTCDIDYPALGTHLKSGTGNAMYVASGLSAGTYTYYANDLTSGVNSIGNTLKVTAVLALDSSNSVRASSANTVSMFLSTSNSPDVILVYGGVSTTNAITATLSDSSGLAWDLQMQGNGIASNYFWNAIAPSPLTNDKITLTFSANGVGNVGLIALAVSGANTISPFDSHSGLPTNVIGTTAGTSASVSISTSNANDMVVVLGGISSTPTSITGSNIIVAQTTGTPRPVAGGYNIVSTTLTSSQFGFHWTSSDTYFFFGDALRQTS